MSTKKFRGALVHEYELKVRKAYLVFMFDAFKRGKKNIMSFMMSDSPKPVF